MPLTCKTNNSICLIRNLVLKRRHFFGQQKFCSQTESGESATISQKRDDTDKENSPSCSSSSPSNVQQQFGHHVHVHNRDQWPPEVLAKFLADCFVLADFVTEDEETQLLNEIYPLVKRLRWEDEHWDGQIQNYREREHLLDNFRPENQAIVRRIWRTSFPAPFEPSPYVHILDLHQDGFISAHLDKSRYCGRVISGLSLLSSSVMRMRHKDNSSDNNNNNTLGQQQQCVADLLLSRRSLYMLSGSARYDFTHAVLAAGESRFGTQPVARERRIALICREVAVPKSSSNCDQQQAD